MKAALRAALAIALAAPLPAGAQAAPELVRCAPGSAHPCIRARLPLDPDAGDSVRWGGEAGGIHFREVDVRIVRGAERPLVLLVLFDVSGSMAGEGMQQTRSALRTFLRGLAGSPAEVAVVPFGSRGVTDGVRAARFGPPAAAEAQMDALPAPAGNTGLYSAVQVGAEVLAARMRAAPAGARGILLVLTDGRNDVGHPGDEPGLLAGADGRAAAAAAVADARHPAWVVGIGRGVDAAELAALAGPAGAAHTVEFDPVRLGRTLQGLRGTLSTTGEATAVLPPWALGRLARGEAGVRIRFAAPGAEPGERTGRWAPPLMALPAFAGVAAPSRPLPTRAEGGTPRTLWVAAFWATLLGVLAWVVPALAWPVRRVARAAPTAAPPGDGLRAGVREAPPRGAGDVTAALARRIVVRT